MESQDDVDYLDLSEIRRHIWEIEDKINQEINKKNYGIYDKITSIKNV
jgi:hypothetical protein